MFLWVLAMASTATAEPLVLSTLGSNPMTDVQAINFSSEQSSFDTALSANTFERHRFSDNLRVRGWRVAQDLYFGQAKVADRWGIGLLLKKDKVVYGVNHRGVQITRQF
jgi:hypothetical protein